MKYLVNFQYWVIHFCIILCSIACESCNFVDLSRPLHSILCAVETETWKIPPDSPNLKNVGCLIGKNRCAKPLHVPTKEEVPVSPPPPKARNPQYQQLATIAETVVPKTWWREGFADDKLLLSHNNDELPLKLFDSSILSNKKLKNIYQCVTRQQFMRKSYEFDSNSFENSTSTSSDSQCVAMSQPVVLKFFSLWEKHSKDMDGEFSHSSLPSGETIEIWVPKLTDQGALLLSATEVLEHFYTNYGGIWTGCFAYEKSPSCRGALAGNIQSIVY
jgi:hypothetical protein